MKRYIQNKHTIVAFILTLLNILFIDNQLIANTIVVAEIIILLNLIRLNRIPQFISWFIIFLATSIEFSVFVSNDSSTQIYGFKHFRIYGIGISTLFIYMSFIYIIIKSKLKIYAIRKIDEPINFFSSVSIMLMIAVSVGLINILINDNNIQKIPNYFALYLGEIYMGTWPILVFYIVYVALIKYPEGEQYISRSLFAMFIANATAPLLPALFGVSGSYGNLPYMLVSNSAMLSPFIIIFYYYKEYKSPLFILLFVAGTIIPLLYFSYINGKILIVLMLLPFVLIYYLYRSRRFRVGAVLTISLMVIAAFIIFPSLEKKEGTLFHSKYREVVSLLDVGNVYYVASLDPSSQFRYYEFANLIAEYKKKPIYLLTGKGFMGSIKDEAAGFPFSESGGFPLAEYNASVFYSLHEISSYLLTFGLIGILTIIILLFQTVRSISYNPWLIIGAYWFVIFYGYSITLSAVGVTCLSYGYYISNINIKNINDISRFSKQELPGMTNI